MACSVLPASPNWYCSRVSDCHEDGTFIYGARGCIYVYNVSCNPPKFIENFFAHSEKVSSVSINRFSAPGHTVVSSTGDDGKVKVWDLGNGNTLLKEHIHNRGKLTVAEWSPTVNGLILCGDDKGNVLSWEPSSGYAKYYKPENGILFCLANSLHQKSVVVVGYKSGLILVLDFSTEGAVLHRLRGHEDEVHCVTWCPLPEAEWVALAGNSEDVPSSCGGFLVASGSRDRTIRLWSTSKGRCVQTQKIPTNTGQRRPRYEDNSRQRLWLTMTWADMEGRLVSSSNSGELLLWDFKKDGKQKWETFNAYKSHIRIVFNISRCGNTLCTISMDRQIGIWNLDSLLCDHLVPSLGGFAYCIAVSALHPDKLAIGVGDDMIRVWDVSNLERPYEADVIWQGVKGKVTCLSWHPTNENILAYGTEDGKVGVHDVASSRPALISSTYHKKTVYVVTWGPLLPDTGSSHFAVYSCGDGSILLHNLKKMDKEAKNLQDFLPEQHKETTKIRSEICWKPDFSFVAFGNSDGSVEVYSASDWSLLCTIQVHRKLINCLRWHPQYTVSNSNQSPLHCWLAIGSNELSIDVVDLSQVLLSERPDGNVATIVTSSVTLEGHHNRVTCLCWSPHAEGHLVSASYDGSAQVWDVVNKRPLANFRGHSGRVLGVQWSLTDPDLVYSCGDDFTVRSWKISKQEHILPKKERHKRNRGQQKPKQSPTQIEPSRDNSAVSGSGEIEELKKMLETKKRELMLAQGGAVSQEHSTETPVEESAVAASGEQLSNTIAELQNGVTESSLLDRAPIVQSILGFGDSQYSPKARPETSQGMNNEMAERPTDYRKAGKPKKRKEWKSLFPVTGTLENRGKVQSHDDISVLSDLVYGNLEIDQRFIHLGLFHNRGSTYQLYQAEIDHHLAHGYIDGAIYLYLWKGSIGGAISLASEHRCLSDWMVAVTAQACHQSYTDMCCQFSLQLEGDGLYHKAATYLLAAHQVYEAIDLLQRHSLFREALAVAKVRLSSSDPVIQSLCLAWASQLVKDGGYEQAAKCFIAAGQPLEAAKLLSRRRDESGLNAAIRVCLAAKEFCEARRLALTYCFELMVKNEDSVCDLGDILARSYGEFSLKYFELVVGTRNFLCTRLKESGEQTGTTPVGDSEKNLFAQLSEYIKLRDVDDVGVAIKEVQSYQPVAQVVMDTGQLLLHVAFTVTLALLHLSQRDQYGCLNCVLSACRACFKSSHFRLLELICCQGFPQGARKSFNNSNKSVSTENSDSGNQAIVACENLIQSVDKFICYCKLIKLSAALKRDGHVKCTAETLRGYWAAAMSDGVPCGCDRCLRLTSDASGVGGESGAFPVVVECAQVITELCEDPSLLSQDANSAEALSSLKDQVVKWGLEHIAEAPLRNYSKADTIVPSGGGNSNDVSVAGEAIQVGVDNHDA